MLLMDAYDKIEDCLSKLNGEPPKCVKYEKNGLWGLKPYDGKILSEPFCDQIEICAEFIYFRYGSTRVRYYFYEHTIDSDSEESRFYENGKVGLKNSDGSVSFPAEYDEIYDWGEDCDVVYTRIGKEFHYYNHKHEEILTEYDRIPDDKQPLVPYFLGEDPHRYVLVCVEPISEPTCGRDCFAYNQWVRLSLIPQSQIIGLFTGCKLIKNSNSDLGQFKSPDTYLYSARTCMSSGENPVSECIERLKTLGCYESSWQYLLKISCNRNTQIRSDDLCNAINFYKRLKKCIGYYIVTAYDDSLKDGEVRAFQVHYYGVTEE